MISTLNFCRDKMTTQIILPENKECPFSLGMNDDDTCQTKVYRDI